MQYKQFWVDVDPKHLQEGMPGDPRGCPIYLSMVDNLDTVKKELGLDEDLDRVYVSDINGIEIGKEFRDTFYVEVDATIIDFIKHYDEVTVDGLDTEFQYGFTLLFERIHDSWYVSILDESEVLM